MDKDLNPRRSVLMVGAPAGMRGGERVLVGLPVGPKYVCSICGQFSLLNTRQQYCSTGHLLMVMQAGNNDLLDIGNRQ